MIDARFRPISTWPRARTVDRISPSFKQTLNQTLDRLERELWELDAKDVVIETAHNPSHIRNDGWPRGNAPDPADPGVIVSFASRHGSLRIPSDRFNDWRANLHVVALHLEHLRLASVWGVGQYGEQYKGWARLEAGAPIASEAAMTVEEAARALIVLSGLAEVPYGQPIRNRDSYLNLYRTAAKRYHPDAATSSGNTDVLWVKLQRAKNVLDAHHGIAKNAGGA